MNRQKYYKYKNKYLNLKKKLSDMSYIANLEDPDPYYLEERNNNNDDYLPSYDIPQFPFNLPTDTDIITEDQQETIDIYEHSDTVGNVQESDENPDNEEYAEIIVPDGIVDVGIYGLARGQSEKLYNVTNFINYSQEPDPKKILKIDNIDDFDDFTYKYGAISEDDTLYIHWDKVAKDYKGLYLDEGIRADRQDDAYFNNKYYPSWWNTEFNFEVLIFVKEDFNLLIGKNVNNPVKSKIYNENDFTPQMYIDYNESTKSQPDKIIRLSSYNSFDDFTNKYGLLKLDNNNESYIDINWDAVKADYRGIYIDKDAEIYPDRYKIAFFDGKKYKSWWKLSNMKQLVYIFLK